MLNAEWRSRINRYMNELERHFYRSMGAVGLEGFVTSDQLTFAEAMAGQFQSMPAGTPWGSKWEYGWFRGQVHLPEEAANQRIMIAGIEGEALVFVDGQPRETASPRQRPYITLSRSGQPGRTLDVAMEVYAGHGSRSTHAGPTPPDRDTVPEPPKQQLKVGDVTWGIWQEDAWQLWLDVRTLWQLREAIGDDNALRVSLIDDGLRDFTLICDPELERDAFLASCRDARQRLKPLMEARNGSSAPRFFCFGHGHLDTAWLWPIAESERKAARTLSSQLSLAEEYPDHKFLMSQPAQYVWLERRYPDLYQRVSEAIADGKIIADGAMWVESDTNIAGGEALIRQFLHGKRYFKEHFGVDSRFLWLPDVFGYSAALPQIMAGCDVPYFSTAKIYWNYHGGHPFPLVQFRWAGIDGTEVTVHLCTNYNAWTHPQATVGNWNDRPQKDGLQTRIYPFGHGDGGGGPTREHIEYLHRLEDLEGAPKLKYATPVEFFADMEKTSPPRDRYVGELYFQAHRGVWTSQAKTKKGNRKGELALREAELWGSLAGRAFQMPADRLDEAWKSLLTNQFHDILPGSSIARVYAEAEDDYEQIIDEATSIAREAAGTFLEPDEDAVTVFNSLSWPRKVLVKLPAGFAGAIDDEDDLLCVQEYDGGKYVETLAPAMGMASLRAGDGPRNMSACPCAEPVRVGENTLENAQLKVTFDRFGRIESLWDKEAGRELSEGPCNEMRMYKDVPTKFDAWDIDSMYVDQPVELSAEAEITPLTPGNQGLFGKLRIRRKLNDSTLTQIVTLRRDSRRIDFETTVDWQERHKLLKVAFPVAVHAKEAIHEIQFGHVRRPTHQNMQFDADRFEVPNHKWTALAEEGRGAAVLNDCKYGVSTAGNTICLTLLKSAMAPDQHADRGTQQFTYAFYAWNDAFYDAKLIPEAYDLNVPALVLPGRTPSRSLLAVDSPDVVVETVKPAEDGSGDLVIRLYEAMRTATQCTLTLPEGVGKVVQTNMLEEPQPKAPKLKIEGGKARLSFRPFEVKTLRCTR